MYMNERTEKWVPELQQDFACSKRPLAPHLLPDIRSLKMSQDKNVLEHQQWTLLLGHFQLMPLQFPHHLSQCMDCNQKRISFLLHPRQILKNLDVLLAKGSICLPITSNKTLFIKRDQNDIYKNGIHLWIKPFLTQGRDQTMKIMYMNKLSKSQ